MLSHCWECYYTFTFSKFHCKQNNPLWYFLIFHLVYCFLEILSLQGLLSLPQLPRKTNLYPSCLSETEGTLACHTVLMVMPVSQWDWCTYCILKMPLPPVPLSQLPCSSLSRPLEQLSVKYWEHRSPAHPLLLQCSWIGTNAKITLDHRVILRLCYGWGTPQP